MKRSSAAVQYVSLSPLHDDHKMKKAAGNPSSWSCCNMNSSSLQQQLRQHPLSSSSPNSSSSSPSSSCSSLYRHSYPTQPLAFPLAGESLELPADHSWSQLLLGDLIEEVDDGKCNLIIGDPPALQFKDYMYQRQQHEQTEGGGGVIDPSWSHAAPAVISSSYNPQYAAASFAMKSSAVAAESIDNHSAASFSSNMLDFSSIAKGARKHHKPDYSDQCINSSGGSAMKKARASSTQSSLKVRKEKLGDRVAALHQLVSPFGKTDTASVLLEAIGSIRFLHTQIEALTLPYLGNESRQIRSRKQQQQQQEVNGMYADNTTQDIGEEIGKKAPVKDLRSRGLCLVPTPLTLHAGDGDCSAICDQWTSMIYGGGGY